MDRGTSRLKTANTTLGCVPRVNWKQEKIVHTAEDSRVLVVEASAYQEGVLVVVASAYQEGSGFGLPKISRKK